VESLQAQVLAQPEIRDVRVRALQLSIGDGTYTVGPQQIADAIASEVSGVAR
jgi:anti-sigma28 factor (negative regulator of flagellin synthesis)